MLPFTRDQFFDVFAAYNLAVWPIQILAYALGLAVALVAVRGSAPLPGRIIAVVLAILWGWTGIAYHGVFFSQINPAAKAFAALFVIQGALLLFLGAWRRDLRLDAGALHPADRWLGFGLMFYAAVIYPLIGIAAGHHWPAMPTFGITPCPLTIFTFGVFLVTTVRARLALLAVPVLWSLIGGSAAVLLAVPQDWMLPVAGAITVLRLAGGQRTRLDRGASTRL